MDTLAQKLGELHIDITSYPVDPKDIEYQFVPDLKKERREIWEKARNTFNTEAQELSDNIEMEFRAMLGVEN
ncbi:MAG: hypothetical protein WAX69_12365 [Victivallales bacterium]